MKIHLLMNQIMAIKLYFEAELVVLHPDRLEGLQRGTTWLLFSLAAWAAWSPILPACHTWQKTVFSAAWKV